MLFSSDLHGMDSAYELLDELPGEGEDPVEMWNNGGPRRRMDEALALRVRGLEAILDSARVPVLIVLGNHDRAPWPDTQFVTDIHMRRVRIEGRSFAGYRWTAMDRAPEEAAAAAA